MVKLNYWKSVWVLDEAQCPCDIHFVQYIDDKAFKDRNIFHMGTGLHHHVGLEIAARGAGNQVLAITASKEEYEAYMTLLIDNPKLGFVYKAYFGDIYQLDRRLLPDLDFATLFHCGEYRSADNDLYGALTDEEVALVLADKLKPGGELLFYTGSFAYDIGQRTAAAVVAKRKFTDMGTYKSLHILKKPN